MYNNDVIIQTLLMRFDLPKVDNTNCGDYSRCVRYGRKYERFDVISIFSCKNCYVSLVI